MDRSDFLEFRKHQTRLFELVQTDQFLSALEKSACDPKSRQAAADNFRDYLKAAGVDVPETFNFRFKPDTWGVCINLGPVSICYSK